MSPLHECLFQQVLVTWWRQRVGGCSRLTKPKHKFRRILRWETRCPLTTQIVVESQRDDDFGLEVVRLFFPALFAISCGCLQTSARQTCHLSRRMQVVQLKPIGYPSVFQEVDGTAGITWKGERTRVIFWIPNGEVCSIWWSILSGALKGCFLGDLAKGPAASEIP